MDRINHENNMQFALDQIKAALDDCDCVLVGLGQEWSAIDEAQQVRANDGYKALAKLLKGKTYFVLIECSDEVIFSSPLLEFFICAPFAPQTREASGEQRWQSYLNWLSSTLGHKLCVLELGVGFEKPELIRWPFEQCVRMNKQARLLRVHHSLALLPEGLDGRGQAIRADSCELMAAVLSQS